MESSIGAFEAKAQLSRLLRAVEQGAHFTITVRGRPVADLVPHRASSSQGKDVVIITQNKEDIPFDIAHRRYMLYNSRKLDALKYQITKEIKHLLDLSSRERLSE